MISESKAIQVWYAVSIQVAARCSDRYYVGVLLKKD